MSAAPEPRTRKWLFSWRKQALPSGISNLMAELIGPPIMIKVVDGFKRTAELIR